MSNAWRLNYNDIKKVGRNALVFLAPVAIITIELIARNGTWGELYAVVRVWALSVALDFFIKLQRGK